MKKILFVVVTVTLLMTANYADKPTRMHTVLPKNAIEGTLIVKLDKTTVLPL